MTDERDHVHKVARANGKKSTLSVAVSGTKAELGHILAADPKQTPNQGAYVHQGNLELINVSIVVEKHFMD